MPFPALVIDVAASMIAESMAKGFSGFDTGIAWQAVWKDAIIPPDDDTTLTYSDREEGVGCEARAGLTKEKELGWVAAMQTSEAGSRTLEYAYDDYCVSVIASLRGDSVNASFFLERSKNYKNIFNHDSLLMEAKNEDGSWCSDDSTWTEVN